MKPVILVTNDDGYRAAGINALANGIRDLGDIVVVAPDISSSGMSSAITVKVPIRLGLIKDEPGLKIFRCSGTPVDSVKIAINQVLGKHPDLVVSGINHGINTSVSIHYSGTMGAAIEACLNGIPSMGVSLDNYNSDANFDNAVKITRTIIKNVLAKNLPRGICLNVNIPDIEKISGIKICRQANGNWVEEFEKRVDPQGKTYYWLAGYFKDHEPMSEDTDEWALKNNYASVVPCQVDMTAYSMMEELKHWDYELD